MEELMMNNETVMETTVEESVELINKAGGYKFLKGFAVVAGGVLLCTTAYKLYQKHQAKKNVATVVEEEYEFPTVEDLTEDSAE